MLNKILDKSAKITVVDASTATRQLFSDAFKALGFSNTNGTSTIQELMTFLETDDTDLVICSVEPANEFNVINLLTLITQTADLRHIRVCLMVDQEDQFAMLKAFELGAIATLNKPFTKDNLKESLSKFINEVEVRKANAALVAATYLRPYLETAADPQEWVTFEKRMLQIFPGSTELLLCLGQALIAANRIDEAAQILRQAVVIDPAVNERADEIYGKGANGDKLSSRVSNGGSFNALGVNRAVVIDPDETIQSAVTTALTEIGVAEIRCFGDGEVAAAYIKENPDPGLIIQEWRIPKLSGPIFVQRVTKEGGASAPIIVLSSLVQPKDMPLIREMGVSNVVQKPFDRTEFLKCLIWTIQQDRTPSELHTLERKIRRSLRANHVAEAQKLLAQYLGDPKLSEGKKQLMLAEQDYAQQKFDAAKNKCIGALKSSADAVHAFTLLGRTLMQLRDFDGALKCLEKAQALSPNNIERLCDIAETQSELGDQEAAEEAASDASDLDPDAVLVQQAKAKVALAGNDINEAKKIMESLEGLETIISHLNNKAVALARTNRIDESLQEYEKTIKALPEAQQGLRVMVLYNQALAYARANRVEDAKKCLEVVLGEPVDKIKPKASSLKIRIEKSLSEGTPFKLLAADTSIPGGASSGGQTPATEGSSAESMRVDISEVMPNPGEMGCYLIFASKTEDAKISDLLKTPLRFSARAGIKRDETLKAG